MARTPSVPSYRLHKPSGQAVVTVRLPGGGRRDVYLGEYNSPESRREYARIVAEMAANPTPTVTPSGSAGGPASNPTVDQVLLAYWQNHVTRHYRHPDGKPTSEVDEIKRSIAPLRRLYGHTPAAEFGPRGLAAVRQEMIKAGWCRTLVNHRTDRVKRAFKWATAEEMVPVAVYQAIRTLTGLRRGRTEAPESKPVGPADPAHVEATLPRLNPHVRAMVGVQRLTGMRPGEVCRLTFGEIDRSGGVWLYRPARHKTAHHGKGRVIPFGPRAQAVLAAFLVGDRPPPAGWATPADDTARLVMTDAYQEAGRERDAAMLRDLIRPVAMVAGCVVDPAARVFNPLHEREDRYRRLRANRKSKVQPSQASRKKKSPQRVPAAEYRTHSYYSAVSVACKKAGVPGWHPNQLRHLFATEVRKAHGLEAVQVLLGHSRADVTQVYAERDLALAVRVASEVG